MPGGRAAPARSAGRAGRAGRQVSNAPDRQQAGCEKFGIIAEKKTVYKKSIIKNKINEAKKIKINDDLRKFKALI